jgi:hypothetical protein
MSPIWLLCRYTDLVKVITRNFFFKINLLIKNMKIAMSYSVSRDPDLGEIQIHLNFFKISSLSSSNVLRFQDN